jgi:hypothetical protein
LHSIFKTPYNWPTFNQYDKEPSSPNNLPEDVFDSQWWKREVARGVLQKELPLSAIYEAKKISRILDARPKWKDAVPTPVSGDLFPKLNMEYQRPSLEDDIPIETGAPKQSTPRTERRKQHLRRHQRMGRHSP